MFDTVFTTIGSSTRNIRIRNKNDQKIRISSITLQNGEGSSFFLNVDGTPGRSFSDIEIAANDSIYVFIQVKVDPQNSNSPLIISDVMNCTVNGKVQSIPLEAWGQDAYYHYSTNAIQFKDGSFLPYSLISSTKNVDTVWKKNKPHVIYGYLVVDSAQKLTIEAGVRVYLNYKAGLWVYRYGQLRVLGKKGDEVIFQGARREKEYSDEPGQWDRIWINEGSDNNLIDYAIIKNGYIGVQAELFDPKSFLGPGTLTIRNTVIQNMSMWGLYGLAYKINGGNNIISNCQEHSVNLMYGGVYNFYHCTFANFWRKSTPREKATVKINNYTDAQVLDHSFYFGNCIIDGRLGNEIQIDLKAEGNIAHTYTFSSSWLKTTENTDDPKHYLNVTKGTQLSYGHSDNYNFHIKATELQVQGFKDAKAIADAIKYPMDLKGVPRRTTVATGVTAGAYEVE